MQDEPQDENVTPDEPTPDEPEAPAGDEPAAPDEPPADEQRPFAHPGYARRVGGQLWRHSPAVVGHPQRELLCVRRQRHGGGVGIGMTEGVGERLLGDPVDDQLHIRGQLRKTSLEFAPNL